MLENQTDRSYRNTNTAKRHILSEGRVICPAFAHMKNSEVTKREKEQQMQGDNTYGDSITPFRVQRK